MQQIFVNMSQIYWHWNLIMTLLRSLGGQGKAAKRHGSYQDHHKLYHSFNYIYKNELKCSLPTIKRVQGCLRHCFGLVKKHRLGVFQLLLKKGGPHPSKWRSSHAWESAGQGSVCSRLFAFPAVSYIHPSEREGECQEVSSFYGIQLERVFEDTNMQPRPSSLAFCTCILSKNMKLREQNDAHIALPAIDWSGFQTQNHKGRPSFQYMYTLSRLQYCPHVNTKKINILNMYTDKYSYFLYMSACWHTVSCNYCVRSKYVYLETCLYPCKTVKILALVVILFLFSFFCYDTSYNLR